MALNAVMTVSLGVSSVLAYDIDGVHVTTFTYNYATQRITTPARIGSQTFYTLALLDALDQIRRWLTVSRVNIPGRPVLPDDWQLSFNRNPGNGKLTMTAEIGSLDWKGEWQEGATTIELDPRPALDLTVDEFIGLFIDSHEKLCYLALAG